MSLLTVEFQPELTILNVGCELLAARDVYSVHVHHPCERTARKCDLKEPSSNMQGALVPTQLHDALASLAASSHLSANNRRIPA